MNFEINHRNERDVEVPMLLNVAAEMRGQVGSYLDVGACYSYATYAAAMRKILGGVLYHAIDLEFCKETSEIVDDYLVGDVRAIAGSKYDLVSCISVLEHVGIQTKRVEKTLRIERVRFFSRLMDLAKERLIVTFPFGEYGGCPTYANVTSLNITDFMGSAYYRGFHDMNIRFFFNEGPQLGHEWVEIDPDRADTIHTVTELGVRCVCIFDAKRTEQ